MLLATQNPADLDYKALANIGTWWLGRLQTERDKMRVLEGLEGAANTAGGKFDRQLMERTLAGLGARVFLMNNVHEDAPVAFHVRWILSYLSGPLSRPQIKRSWTRSARRKERRAAEDDGFAPPGASSTAEDRNTVRPKLPEDVTELFQPTDEDGEASPTLPAILRSATVVFDDAKKKISGKSSVTLVNVIDIEKQKVLWDKFVDIPKDDDLSKYDSEPVENAAFADLPGPALKSSTYTSIKKDFRTGCMPITRSKSSTVRCWRPIRTPARSRTSSKPASRKPHARETRCRHRRTAREDRQDNEVPRSQGDQSRGQSRNAKSTGQQRHAQQRRQIGGGILGVLWPQERSECRQQGQHRQQRQPRHAERQEAKAAEAELEPSKPRTWPNWRSNSPTTRRRSAINTIPPPSPWRPSSSRP
jgi:hypothetical protein